MFLVCWTIITQGEVARPKNFILILFDVMQGLECPAKRLGLDTAGSEEPLRDCEDLKEIFGAVFQEDCSDANLEQNLHLTTQK